MTGILRFDGVGQVRASGELEGSWGAAEDRVGAMLASAALEFTDLRMARPDEYGYQYDALEEGDDPALVDVTILPEDFEEVVDIVQHRYGVRLSEEDREILECYLNDREVYSARSVDQSTLPLYAADQTTEQAAPGVDKYARALELHRRHMATSAFLGVDPSRQSCDCPILTTPTLSLGERNEPDPAAVRGGYTIHVNRSTGEMTVTQYEQGGNDE